ncbi:undecaprenyl-diphosphate phosphatase [Candidatus Saccharibacteria bacterium TM7i]|nr:undecaprenyl-diphosphate phosphatase [Candidatus Saccharibacteria bacterium TM7i]
MWHWLETIILGLIQGLTEFIPISSSGHLVIAQTFMTGASDHLFLEFINIGTMLALLVFFRKRIWAIIKDVFVHRNYTLARNILITAIPAGLVGFILAGFISTTPFFMSATVVVFTLAIVGAVMVVLEKLPKLSPVKDGSKLPWWRALIVGGAQVLALIPGTSRSGSTIIAGRLMGLSPAQAAEYSFLASLPIMAGVTLKVLVSDTDYLVANAGMLAVSNAAAFISGLLAVGFLMRYLSKHSLAIFGWYRIGLAAILAIILLVQ